MKHREVGEPSGTQAAVLTPATTESATPVPRHVAIIMDGNRRWATERNLPQFMGHVSGARRIRPLVERCMDVGVEYLTLFAFSTENWRRPADEVSALTKLFLHYLRKEAGDLHSQGIRLKVIGDISPFATPLRQLFLDIEKLTEKNTRLTLLVAVNYGGRWDMVQAIRRWLADHVGARPEEASEESLAPYLSTAGMPDPDLLIRTGGEVRVSNFMLWQMAYTEMFFTDLLFPAFVPRKLDQALAWYAGRQRRFGASIPSQPDVEFRVASA